MTGKKFTIDDPAADGFYVTVAENITVYEEYDDAIAEIEEKISIETESFLAEVAIETNGDGDVALALEQVGWQQIIQDMAQAEDSL